MSQDSASINRPLPPPLTRTIISIGAPLLIAGIVTAFVANLTGVSTGTLALPSVFLGALGLASWYMGGNWYGSKGMGLRGGRPFYAGAGFAFLGWIVILIARLSFVGSNESQFLQEPLFPTFMYLLLFEAFAVQMWAFGLVFRGISDWRGPLTAAVGSGLLFSVIGLYIFQESFAFSAGAALYFVVWGLFYGLIRLRTGSIIGIIIVQAMQSLTAWWILPPQLPLSPATFSPLFYTVMGIWYAILIWRLWPSEAEDYRV